MRVVSLGLDQMPFAGWTNTNYHAFLHTDGGLQAKHWRIELLVDYRE